MTNLSRMTLTEPWFREPWRSIPSVNILITDSAVPVTWSIISDGPVMIATQLDKDVAAYIVALHNRELESRPLPSGEESPSCKCGVGARCPVHSTDPHPAPGGWIAWGGRGVPGEQRRQN